MVLEQNMLTDAEFEKGNIWLKHVFAVLARGEDASECYGWNYSELDFEDLRPQFEKMWEFICNQDFDADFTDGILARWASISYSNVAMGTVNNGEKFDFTAEQLARILVNFCRNCNVYWNNKTHTTQEKEFFEKTLFGKTVKDLDCYLFDDVANNQQPAQQQSQKQPRAPRGSGVGGNWKNAGPLSDKANCLVGQPHNKIYPNVNYMYKIVDKSIPSKKEIHAIVRPLNNSYATPNGLAVIVSNSNNLGDFLCLFDNQNDAAEFIRKAQAKYTAGTLSAASVKVDSNGYFLFDTELGRCYCRAFGFNEELEDNRELEESSSSHAINQLTEEELQYFRDYNRD